MIELDFGSDTAPPKHPVCPLSHPLPQAHLVTTLSQGSQGQNLALTILYVPYSLDSRAPKPHNLGGNGSCLQGYLAHKKTPAPPRTTIGP